MVASIPELPFHRGEQCIQTRLGVRERVERVGRRAIRRELTDRDRDLFARLPIVFIGSVDGTDRPWASVLGWDMNAEYEFVGAERFVRFELEEGVLIRNGLPIRWRFSEWSPTLEQTGEWA